MFEAIIGDYAYLLAHYGSLKGPDRDYYVRRTSSSGSPKTTPVLPPSVPAKYNFRQARRQQEGIDRKLTTLQGKLIGRVRTRFFSRPRNNTMGMGEGMEAEAVKNREKSRSSRRIGQRPSPLRAGKVDRIGSVLFPPLSSLSFLPLLFENNLDNFEFFRIFDIRSEEELIIISLFRFEIV